MAEGDEEAWRVPAKPKPSPLWWVLGAAALAGILVLLAIVALALRTEEGSQAGLAALSWSELVAAGALGFAVAMLGIGITVRVKMLLPIRRLAAETRFVAESKTDRAVSSGGHPWLDPLPRNVGALAAALTQERARRAADIAQSTRELEAQKIRLETILRDLAEGVLICTLDHRVLLYNHAALGLLHVAGELGLGRSLFNLVAREPIVHALERLLADGGAAAPREDVCTVVCTTADATRLLLGRISLTRAEPGRATGYVLTLGDVTSEVAELEARDRLLRDLGDGLRRPIANLHAAAETLASFPGMDAARRQEFDEVVRRESAALAAHFEQFDRSARDLRGGHWPLADVLSLDLFRIVARRCRDQGGPALTPVGLPRWLHADSQSLVVALARVARRIVDDTGAQALDLEAVGGERSAYIDISWAGPPIASARLDAWLGEPLAGALGASSLADVLQRHGSTLWSRSREEGRAVLRMPVPAARETPREAAPARSLPPRPEFYDFALLGEPASAGAQLLQRLTFVVFDTETTGLRPSEGDEIVSIGAVRVVNGRILTGETFSRLVNPRRPIPAESIRFHGITDDMVEQAPPAVVVVPQFRAFCEGAVLVAHNAAFDLKFLKLKEAETGSSFDMPALDTLLISAFLYPDIADHDLDAIARRVDVEIAGRHTALGDAMATAAVFVRLLDQLAQRGITTLEALMSASRMAAELRARAAHF
ncbi:MAG: PAS domain-containing protein [Alphaproteobacteria bacterium]|nr:PAS domain-containing protein [Alphaproteobacteria bacterium]